MRHCMLVAVYLMASSVSGQSSCTLDPSGLQTAPAGTYDTDTTTPSFQYGYFPPKTPQGANTYVKGDTSYLNYGYAWDNAFVALPAACVTQTGLTPNMGDRGDPEVDNLWYGRMSSLIAQGKSPDACACGWVLYASGSGGLTGNNQRFGRMLARMGFGFVAPDTFSQNDFNNSYFNHTRYKTPNVLNSTTLATYWDTDMYTGGCTAAIAGSQYPYCYDTKWELIANNRTAWGDYYEAVFYLRKLELDYAVETMATAAFSYMLSGKVFLMGTSEGGMVAGRYYHPTLDAKLTGRIISSWSCERNYYVACTANAGVCGGSDCRRSVPVLNLVSTRDPYFGPEDSSVSSLVAVNGPDAPHNTITGNCFKSMTEGGFTQATSIVLPNSGHDETIIYDNLIRTILYQFSSDPAGLQTQIRSGSLLSPYCSVSNSSGGSMLARCNNIGGPDGTPVVIPEYLDGISWDGKIPVYAPEYWQTNVVVNCTDKYGCKYYSAIKDLTCTVSTSGSESSSSSGADIGVTVVAVLAVMVGCALCLRILVPCLCPHREHDLLATQPDKGFETGLEEVDGIKV